MSAQPSKTSSDAVTASDNANSTTAAQKAVTIFEEPEHIPPDQSDLSLLSNSPKIHRASISGKKMTGRAPPSPTLSRTISSLKLEDGLVAEPPSPGESSHSRDETRKLLSQVQNWLSEEKSKRQNLQNGTSFDTQQQDSTNNASTDLHQDLALETLEKILHSFAFSAPPTTSMELRPKKSQSSSSLRRGSIAKAFKRSAAPPASSDTEWAGEDINVPHVEASLDNTKTLAFTGGATDIGDVEMAQQRDMKHWHQFKQDIVRLTHTLRLRGWRKIPIENGHTISVERLSGALTNAVYVVKPPKELPEPFMTMDSKREPSKSRPTELLLRVYGPRAQHLIDRDVELGILRRLARKKIGPRLLGYFSNGRFEEYLHAKTLDAKDLHVPATAKQIAKRMRELHDGVDLLPSEREGGPKAFNNWDKYVDRCEKVITWLDTQVKLEREGHTLPSSRKYTKQGFVCGVEWPVFRDTYAKYRQRVIKEYGGERAIQRRLVFAHNDTQYGNLMRLDPPGDSPLLQPANQHRQLVVIDFEYAGANCPGFEFANHFTEWCYNYHHPDRSWACNTNYYPTRQEQHTFVRSYVMHRPQFHPGASATPKMDGREKTIISDFMLDARQPPSLGAPAMDYDEEERRREEKVESDVQTLLHETRLWRIANAAQWVAWGIVQAKVPELDDDQPPPPKSKSKTSEKVTDLLDRVRGHLHAHSDPLDPDVEEKREAAKRDRPEGREQEDAHREGEGETDGHHDHGGPGKEEEEEEEEEEVEEFDCLAYAQDRAMLFWGDCLQMGIVTKEELPQSLVEQVKFVDR